MATLNQQLERVKKLSPEKIVSDVFKFIKSIEKELVAYNVATLNQDSEDIFGNPIGFYSKGTEFMTNGRKKAGEPFDLLESGDFLESVFAKVQKDSVLFDASDTKKKEVFKNLLSNNIFGLQEPDLNKVIRERILPFLQNNIIRKGLGI
tara:strand:- start:6946 stop:7392 length:447 start_codon:yes stop_codon:yes gene_type:complete